MTLRALEKKAGFSLMEIIIALAVLSILFGTVGPLLMKFNEAMEKKKTLTEMKDIETGLLQYYRDTGKLPTGISGDDLDILIASTSTAAGFNGPYMTASAGNAELKDAWGGDYQFSYSGPSVIDVRNTQSFTLNSAGSDFDIATTNDNLSLVISTRAVTDRIMTDTLERVRVVMAVVAELQLDLASSNIFTELAASASSYVVSADPACESSSQGAIDHGALGDRLSCFYRRDQWGTPLLWHDDTNQFYSAGPNRADNTGIATSIQPGDIGGNF
ncbi:MAG: type II secretion system protein GspG [SAR324 cluster bacterium]|nr:type II secretion system protein GspG [SAR324 cluster bacterium]